MLIPTDLPPLDSECRLHQERAAMRASQVALVVKNLPATAGDVRDVHSNPGSGRYPRGGNSIPLQYSCLENSMDTRAWQATVHGVMKSQTQWSAHGWAAISLFPQGILN